MRKIYYSVYVGFNDTTHHRSGEALHVLILKLKLVDLKFR